MNKFFIYIVITFTAFTSVQAQHPRVCDYVSLKHALKGREIDFMSPGPYTEGFVQTVKHSKKEIRIGVINEYGNTVIESERLTIPHPLMHLRDFVLMPLAEIAPDTVHPTLGNSIAGLLAEIRK